MGKIKLEIVIPARNAGAYISETIESLQQQGLSNWLAYVVDDGSKDDTCKCLDTINDSRISILHTDGLGAPLARNLGLQQVSSSYVMFLDADDRLRPDALMRLYLALEESESAVLAYGNEMLIDSTGRSFNKQFAGTAERPSGQVLEKILSHCFIPTTGAALLRTALVKRVQGFTADLPASQDWDLWCRMALHGSFIHVDGEPVIDYRIHEEAMSRNLQPERYTMANEAVFSHPEIIARLPGKTLARLKALREASNFYNAAKEALRKKERRAARAWILESLIRNPVNTRAYVLGMCAFTGWMPRSVGRRIGIR